MYCMTMFSLSMVIFKAVSIITVAHGPFHCPKLGLKISCFLFYMPIK